MLNDGSEYRGNYGVSRAELAAFHEERLDVLAAAGPDLLAVETIPDVAEAEVLAGLLDGYDLPAWVSFSCVGDGLTCAGQPYAEACEVAASSARTVAVGVNCSAPQHVAALLTAGRTVTDLPFVVYPNAGGLWDAVHGVWTDQRAKDLPAEQVRGWAAAGALLVGGCCGLGPDAVSGIAAALAA
jgi:homocysteine S-methyltransferase